MFIIWMTVCLLALSPQRYLERGFFVLMDPLESYPLKEKKKRVNRLSRLLGRVILNESEGQSVLIIPIDIEASLSQDRSSYFYPYCWVNKKLLSFLSQHQNINILEVQYSNIKEQEYIKGQLGQIIFVEQYKCLTKKKFSLLEDAKGYRVVKGLIKK